MILRIILLNILACTAFALHGQNVFNNFFEIPEYPTIRNVIAVDSGYIVAGGYKNLNLKVLIGYVDFQGNLVSYKSYGDSTTNWYHGLSGSLIKTSDGGFALAGSTPWTGMLYKFDRNLDTIWKKEYIFPTQTLFYGCAETESGYGLVGAMSDGNGYTQMILVKTDLEGNYQWEKHFGGQYFDEGYNIIKTSDGGFLLGGSMTGTIISNFLDDAIDWYLVKTDSLGNAQWKKHYGNPVLRDTYVCSIIETHDSCYIATGRYTTREQDVCTDLFRPCVMKVNKYGNIIWRKLFEKENDKGLTFSIVENEDFTLTCIGLDYYNNNTIYKLNSNGEVLWKRHVLTNGTASDNAWLQHISKDQQDGGFVLVGYGWDFPVGEFQRAWLVKTDSLGCDGYLSCQDTALAIHVLPREKTILSGTSVTINAYVDNGFAPVTVSYSNGITSYPVYITGDYIEGILIPDASDSIVITPTHDTVVYVTVSYSPNYFVTDSAVIHVTHPFELNENKSVGWFDIYPNPAKDIINIDYNIIKAFPENMEFISTEGKVLKTVNIITNNGKLNIPLDDLLSGVYYVKAGYTMRKLIIIK